MVALGFSGGTVNRWTVSSLAYLLLPPPPGCHEPVSGLSEFQEPAAWEVRVVGLLVSEEEMSPSRFAFSFAEWAAVVRGVPPQRGVGLPACPSPRLSPYTEALRHGDQAGRPPCLPCQLRCACWLPPGCRAGAHTSGVAWPLLAHSRNGSSLPLPAGAAEGVGRQRAPSAP